MSLIIYEKNVEPYTDDVKSVAADLEAVTNVLDVPITVRIGGIWDNQWTRAKCEGQPVDHIKNGKAFAIVGGQWQYLEPLEAACIWFEVGD